MQDDLYLSHHGVKGMKWGVRRKARKDAKETARAKMFYGEGAGNRRKLIKATVKERSKDPYYKEEYEKALAKQDMSKHASAAKKERMRKDAAKTTAKTTRGFVNIATGNIGRASAASVILYGAARATGVDKMIARFAMQKASDFVQNASRANDVYKTKKMMKRWGVDV